MLHDESLQVHREIHEIASGCHAGDLVIEQPEGVRSTIACSTTTAVPQLSALVELRVSVGQCCCLIGVYVTRTGGGPVSSSGWSQA
jgi:hypothetical protein